MARGHASDCGRERDCFSKCGRMWRSVWLPLLAGIAPVLVGAVPARADVGTVPVAGDVDIRPRLLADTVPGVGSGISSAMSATVVNGVMYFRATDATSGGMMASLWRTNGRPGGTRLLDAGRGTSMVTAPTLIPQTRKLLYWSGSDLRSLDLDTQQAITLRTGYEPSFAGLPMVNGSALFVSGGAVWGTDGTPQGTRQLIPGNWNVIAIASTGSFACALIMGNGITEVWCTDGTAGRTWPLTTLPGPSMWLERSNPLRVVGSNILFAHTTGPVSRMWTTDGTTRGTRFVAAVPALMQGVMTCVDGRSVLASVNTMVAGQRGTELWRVSPDAAECGPLLAFDRLTSFLPMGGSNGVSVFVESAGYGSSGERTLWLTDGSPERTFALPGFPGNVEASSRNSNPFVIVGDRLFLLAATAQTGTEPWMIDLRTGATALLRDISPGGWGSYVSEYFVLDHGRGVGFMTPERTLGVQTVFVADGVPEHTRRISRIANGLPFGFTSFGSRIVFATSMAGTGTEPYVLDLCPADHDNSGTVEMNDLFAFIADWLARDANADFDASGGVPGVTDMTAFLGGWMSGCP